MRQWDIFRMAERAEITILQRNVTQNVHTAKSHDGQKFSFLTFITTYKIVKIVEKENFINI